MTDLVPISALGKRTAYSERIGAIDIKEVQDVAIASVFARRGQDLTAEMKNLLGARPPIAGQAVLKDDFNAIWMAADQWLVFASEQTHTDLVSEIKETLRDRVSITEQSDAWFCLDVAGDSVVDLCERLCAVPVRRMSEGGATRTTVHQMGCFIACIEAGQKMRFFAPRSSAGSFLHAVTTAAHSVA